MVHRLCLGRISRTGESCDVEQSRNCRVGGDKLMCSSYEACNADSHSVGRRVHVQRGVHASTHTVKCACGGSSFGAAVRAPLYALASLFVLGHCMPA